MTEAERLQQENAELKARLKAFGAIFRLGNDAFAGKTPEELASHIVNDSRVLLPYIGSTLVELRDHPGRILAQYAQVEVNAHSPQAEALLVAARHWGRGGQPFELGSEVLNLPDLPPEAAAAARVLTDKGRRWLLVPLATPRVAFSCERPFVWCLEFDGALPLHVRPSVDLVAVDYAGALWAQVTAARRWRSGRKLPRWVWFAGLLLLLFGALFLIRVRQNIAAEFVLRPDELHHSEAWFDCVVKECFFEDGDTVRKGDRILAYDTERIRYQLEAAKAAAREAAAEYEQENRAAFSDRERLGKLKILDFRRQLAEVALAEAQWYLDRSVVVAPADGVLALAEGKRDKLVGRSLRSGERQFDILGTGKMVAEIMVGEKDASILSANPAITLFLHTRPELPIPVTVTNARYYPVLTEQNVYSYLVRGVPEGEVPGVRYGMRGVARLAGEPVSLAYWLFRSVVLWYRGV